MRNSKTATTAPMEILDLVVIQPGHVQETFSTPGAILPLLESIADRARAFVPDVSTAGGRKELSTLAAKIVKAKTSIDGMGKLLVDNLKELPKRVDETRKMSRDFLDSLRDEVRKPLTEWEDEQKRAEEAKAAAEAADKLRQEIETLHELALFQNVEFDRKKSEAREALERNRKENEARIAQEAAERVRRELEEKARKERDEAARREGAAELARQRAEQQQKAAEERAKEAESRAARERAEYTRREEQARLQAAEQERVRREALDRKESAEKAQRAADVLHRTQMLVEVEEDLAVLGLDSEACTRVSDALAEGRIRHASINF